MIVPVRKTCQTDEILTLCYVIFKWVKEIAGDNMAESEDMVLVNKIVTFAIPFSKRKR